MKNYLAGGALLLILVAWAASCVYSHHRGVNAGLSECAAQLTTGDRKNANVCTKAADNVVAAEDAKAEKAARMQEQQAADAFAKADQVHQEEMKNAQQKADATIADLRAGTVKLRNYWNSCARATASMPATGTGTGKRDATADVRAENQNRALRDASASRLVQLGAEADAQIKELQAILTAERAKH